MVSTNAWKDCCKCKRKTKGVWRYKRYFYCYPCYAKILNIHKLKPWLTEFKNGKESKKR